MSHLASAERDLTGSPNSGRPAWTRAIRPLDVIVPAYLVIIGGVIGVLHGRVPRWWAYELGCAVGLAAIAVLLAAHRRHPRNRALTLLRFTYPLIASPLFYTVLDGYVLAVHGRFLDAAMNAFELDLYGGHPNLWLDRLVSRPLTEILYAFYIGYYLYIIVPPLVLAAADRIDDLERLTTTVTTAIYTCYLGFIAVPVLGPQHSLAERFRPQELTGYVLVPTQEWLIARGEPLGACFPSAHIAGAWAVLAALRAIRARTAFHLLLAPTLLMTVAVAYTRYHYVTDIAAGLTVAITAHLVVTRIWRRRHLGSAVRVSGPTAIVSRHGHRTSVEPPDCRTVAPGDRHTGGAAGRAD